MHTCTEIRRTINRREERIKGIVQGIGLRRKRHQEREAERCTFKATVSSVQELHTKERDLQLQLDYGVPMKTINMPLER